MSNSVFPIQEYDFSSSDRLFFDTNIWLYIFGPQKPNDKKVRIYSEALKRILSAECQIYIDVLVVSEFVNTYSRIKWHILKKNEELAATTIPKKIKETFKAFRKSPVFKPVARDIACDAKQVVSFCQRVESAFSTLDFEELMEHYAEGNSDFNDQIIAKICERHKLKLITDDADFRDNDFTIITGNKKLLK